MHIYDPHIRLMDNEKYYPLTATTVILDQCDSVCLSIYMYSFSYGMNT